MAQTINEDICTFSARLRGRHALILSAESVRNESWRQYNIHYFGRPEERFAGRGGAGAASSSTDPAPSGALGSEDLQQTQNAGKNVLGGQDLRREDAQQQLDECEEAAQQAEGAEEEEESGAEGQGTRARSPEPRRKQARRRQSNSELGPIHMQPGGHAGDTGSCSTDAPAEEEPEAASSSGLSSLETQRAGGGAKASMESESAMDGAKAAADGSQEVISSREPSFTPEMAIVLAKGRRETPIFGEQGLGLEEGSTEHQRIADKPVHYLE